MRYHEEERRKGICMYSAYLSIFSCIPQGNSHRRRASNPPCPENPSLHIQALPLCLPCTYLNFKMELKWHSLSRRERTQAMDTEGRIVLSFTAPWSILKALSTMRDHGNGRQHITVLDIYIVGREAIKHRGKCSCRMNSRTLRSEASKDNTSHDKIIWFPEPLTISLTLSTTLVSLLANSC